MIKGEEALVGIDQVSSDCRQKQELEVKEGAQKRMDRPEIRVSRPEIRVSRPERQKEVKPDVKTAVRERTASKNKG